MCMKIRQIVPESRWPATCNHRGVAALTFLCQQARAACQKGSRAEAVWYNQRQRGNSE